MADDKLCREDFDVSILNNILNKLADNYSL